MKKLTYLFAAAAIFAACNGGNKGYVVTGTVEEGINGDTVYLATVENRRLVNIDTAVISNGKFVFKGVQDTAVQRYITYKGATPQDGLSMDFYLENGKINVTLSKENDSATGTPANDAYQAIRSQLNGLNKEMMAIYEAMATDTTLTEEQRTAQRAQFEKLQEQTTLVIKEGIAQNIKNIVGINLLKQNYYSMGVEELDPLLSQIPAEYNNDKGITRIKENVEKMKATAVGQKFIDFEMKDPEGNTVKLSDYAGKGKVVLVDFWASWCGPCRREMPNLVEAYKQYKNKGFEIVGVSLDRDANAWKKAIAELKITWPQMSDLKFWECEGAQLYAVNSIPHVVLLDAEGTIIARGLHGEELQKAIAEAIK